MARRTSLHVSSMARLDLFCCCNMACITRSFFLFMDMCLLERLFLADVGCELGEQRMDLLEQVIRDHLWVQEVIIGPMI